MQLSIGMNCQTGKFQVLEIKTTTGKGRIDQRYKPIVLAQFNTKQDALEFKNQLTKENGKCN